MDYTSRILLGSLIGLVIGIAISNVVVYAIYGIY